MIENKVTYKAYRGNFYTHDETLFEIDESLIYKTPNMDITVYNNLTLDSLLTKEEAIKMYIDITDVCLYGVNKFIKSLTEVKDSYTVQEIVDLTSDEVGNYTLRKFFKI